MCECSLPTKWQVGTITHEFILAFFELNMGACMNI